MKYTEHQIAVLEVVKDLIQKGAVEIKISKHVFDFGPIIIKANQSVQPTSKLGG